MAPLVCSVPLSCKVLLQGDVPKTGAPENEMLRSLTFILQLWILTGTPSLCSQCRPTPMSEVHCGSAKLTARQKVDSGGWMLFWTSLFESVSLAIVPAALLCQHQLPCFNVKCPPITHSRAVVWKVLGSPQWWKQRPRWSPPGDLCCVSFPASPLYSIN